MKPGTPLRTLLQSAWLCLLVSLPLTGVHHTHAQDESSLTKIRQQLKGPVQLLLKNGSRPAGRITHWDGRQLRIKVSLDAGQAEMTYAAADIREIRFPGGDYLGQLREWTQDPARTGQALELFEAFYEQRSAYLDYLTPAELNLFVEYLRFALSHGQPELAIRLVEALRPKIEDPAQIEALDNALLLASFQTGKNDEAAQRAEAWIERAPRAGESALGWRILAEIHFRNKDYEACLWTALYPIAFAHQILPEHLDLCYAFAIAAARENRQEEVAERLIGEMGERGLAWPTEHVLLDAYQHQPAAPSAEETKEELAEPLQSPSPLDPMEALPTRIKQPVQRDASEG